MQVRIDAADEREGAVEANGAQHDEEEVCSASHVARERGSEQEREKGRRRTQRRKSLGGSQSSWSGRYNRNKSKGR